MPHYSSQVNVDGFATFMFLLAIFVVYLVAWFVYYNMTKFTRVITVADKFMKTKQVGELRVSSNHMRQRTDVSNTRRTVEEYFLLDTNRTLYNVNDCLLCGLHIGSFGKYAGVVVGDKIEIQGYGGYFSGIPDIYSVRRLA